jgi:hypothetical protein
MPASVNGARPELYLDGRIRSGISSFSKLELTQLKQGLTRLQTNLAEGIWDQSYGYLRQQENYDAGYRFVYSV